MLVVRNEEARATQLINELISIGASVECRRKAIPFVCQHLFGLCGGLGVFIQPTSSQCEEIREVICQQEWGSIEKLSMVQDCAMFPAETSSCPALNESHSTNETVLRSMLGAVSLINKICGMQALTTNISTQEIMYLSCLATSFFVCF